MPYLHWETSKKREYFASEMDKIMTANAEKKKREEEKKRLKRIEERESSNGVDSGFEPKRGPTRWKTGQE